MGANWLDGGKGGWTCSVRGRGSTAVEEATHEEVGLEAGHAGFSCGGEPARWVHGVGMMARM